MAHGRIEARDGARQAAGNGVFTFTGGTGTYNRTTRAVATTFKGSVRFVSTAHRFDIKLADVKVSTKGRTGTLTADVTAEGRTRGDVPFASLDLSAVRPGGGAGGAMTFAKIPAKLTAEGAKAFNGMYPKGQVLDAATLTVKPATSAGRPSHGSDPGRTRPSTPAHRPAPAPAHRPVAKFPHAPAAGAPAPRNASAAAQRLVDGRLDWGVRESFRKYVTGPIGRGTIETADGATASAAGFAFPKGHGTYDTTASSLNADFDGSVRFRAHEGVLDMSFANLGVRISGTKGTLRADVSAKSRTTGKVTVTKDMAVADLAVPAGALTAKNDVVTLSGVPATLTTAGAGAFGGDYRPGERLDPVGLSVTLTDRARLASAESRSAAASSSAVEAAKAAPGAATFSGGGGAGGSAGGGAGADSLAATGSAAPVGPMAASAAVLLAAGGAATYAARRRPGTGA
ncbi:HtaA domain-containing protein [Streptomyces sp. MST-110588]|uniref:HtaA domain-containing protein n=1 Tax=Streptomyces sp. MST-110588 TaxID=2833628 RepID=UPI003241E7AD